MANLTIREFRNRRDAATKEEQKFQRYAQQTSMSYYDTLWHKIKRQLVVAATLGKDTAVVGLTTDDIGQERARDIQTLEQTVRSQQTHITDVLVGDSFTLASDLEREGFTVTFQLDTSGNTGFTKLQLVVSF